MVQGRGRAGQVGPTRHRGRRKEAGRRGLVGRSAGPEGTGEMGQEGGEAGGLRPDGGAGLGWWSRGRGGEVGPKAAQAGRVRFSFSDLDFGI